MNTFVPPPRTVFGSGSRARIADVVGDARAVHVVSDEGVLEAGVVEQVTSHLAVEPTVHADVSPNPDRETVLSLADRLADADLVIGIGGGSVMDATKAACSIPTFPERAVSDLEITPETPVADASARVPFVLVPTTAGTGTETGHWAVISDHDRREKRSLGHPSMLANAAVLDPELTASLPPYLTAITGIDVLTHALESLTADGAAELTKPYSRRAYELVTDALVTAATESEDETLAAREQLLSASYLAGVAMNNAGLGAVHAISHAIGGRHDLPHGRINAVLLPAVVRHNGERSPRARAEYASLVGTDRLPHDALADRIEQLLGSLDLEHAPPGFPPELECDDVAASAVENINMSTDPVDYTADDVIEVCHRAFP